MKNSILSDIDKQIWETREQLEHTYNISRDVDIRRVKLYEFEDSMKANMIGWVEALSWVKEKLDKGDK